MKKDAYYYGTMIAFIAFFLMIAFFIYDAWKASRLTTQVGSQDSLTGSDQTGLSRNFARFQTVRGEDGTVMVLIPEGPYQMGSPPGGGDSDESPQHAVFVPAFFMDQREVTQGQYAEFAKATGFPKAAVPVFQEEMSNITGPDLPVVGISWDGAKAYCEWTGKRLPTEAEWEKAAGGEDSFKWPWGNEAMDRAANLLGEEDGYRFLAPPAAFESGRSPYGLYDMAGNVAEWVSDWYDAEYYKISPFKIPKGPEKGKFHVYRGGSWNDSIVNARAAKRFPAAPHQTSAVIGVRCAKDGPQSGS